jgi:ribosomal protein S18 acetylase RimI-like enzyme
MAPAADDGMAGAVTSRPVRRDDYASIVRLLQKTVQESPPGHNWDLRRWEGTCWYHPDEGGNPGWHENSRIWQTASDRTVGLVHADGIGFAYLEIDPGYRHLEPEMIAWAEDHLAGPLEGGGRQVHVLAFAYDADRQDLLAERGYEQTASGTVHRQLRLDRVALREPSPAEGYMVRETIPGAEDAGQIAELLNAAFGRTFHTALEYECFTQRATSFRRELDLVAVAPGGRMAAYVGVPYDEPNRRGIFEPVCTHPQHRRLGLASALMREGLLRLRALGARSAIVETGSANPANRLYESIGFTEAYAAWFWRRQWA